MNPFLVQPAADKLRTMYETAMGSEKGVVVSVSQVALNNIIRALEPMLKTREEKQLSGLKFWHICSTAGKMLLREGMQETCPYHMSSWTTPTYVIYADTEGFEYMKQVLHKTKPERPADSDGVLQSEIEKRLSEPVPCGEPSWARAAQILTLVLDRVGDEMARKLTDVGGFDTVRAAQFTDSMLSKLRATAPEEPVVIEGPLTAGWYLDTKVILQGVAFRVINRHGNRVTLRQESK